MIRYSCDWCGREIPADPPPYAKIHLSETTISNAVQRTDFELHLCIPCFTELKSSVEFPRNRAKRRQNI